VTNRILLNGQRKPKKLTQTTALQAVAAMRESLAAMRSELAGAVMVTAILLDRYAGGSASITQQEMIASADWKLRNGFTTGDRPSDGVWLFTVEKPDVPVDEQDEAGARKIAAMTAEEFDAYVREREAKEGQQPPAGNAQLEGDDDATA
jgi:hypothetical protein